MEDFKKFIEGSALADPTKKVHLNNIIKLGDNLRDKSIKNIIKNMEQNHTVNQIFQLNKTLSKYLDYVGRHKDRKVLLEYSRKVNNEMTTKQQMNTCSVKTNIENGTLKTKEQLFEALEQLYVEGNYKSYVINYLLLHFHTRNSDLDLIVTTNKKDVDDDNNYLLLRKSKVEFIRNNYKTKDLYGTKKYTIMDKKFIKAVKQLEETTLFRTTNIGKEIRKHTIDGLTESTINKIIMYSLPVNELEHISQSRGTSITTLLSNYNPNKCI